MKIFTLYKYLAISIVFLCIMLAENINFIRSKRILNDKIAEAKTDTPDINITQKQDFSSSTAPITLSTSTDINCGFSHIVEPVLSSVVNVTAVQGNESKIKNDRPKIPLGNPFEELFREFFDDPQFALPRKIQSIGSGFIVRISSDEAYIVTNYHVIKDADKVYIHLYDKTELNAVVHAVDERTDIAILKIILTDLPDEKRSFIALEWGDSDAMCMGDWVIAMGNPFGLGSSATVGIISSKGRELIPYNGCNYFNDYVDNFLQHSAQINMGNSGGCLLNIKRQVIGVNTAILSPMGGNIGIGFAIPSIVAKPTVEQLITFGCTKRGWIGVRLQRLTSDMAEALDLKSQGVIVVEVIHESPAEIAGIQKGDIIIEYDGKVLNEQNRLARLVGETEIGKIVLAKICRKSKEIVLSLTIQGYKEDLKNRKIEKEKIQKETAIEIFGISLSPITEGFRERFKMPRRINSVLITAIELGSAGEYASLFQVRSLQK